ncbi:MAG: tetratricopeptide repeat protein [Ignavibacteria bacterium]|nr:tetratricopeptide repeat protein [Ignavibacteria bacterium]
MPVTFLLGDAGMGKTTLLREVEVHLNAHGDERCVLADCSAPVAGIDVGSVEALHPWIAVMKALATTNDKSKTQSLVTDLAMAWIKFVPIVGDLVESTVSTVGIVRRHRQSTTEQPTSKEHVFQQCISFFNAVGEKQKLVIIIDDAHWADNSSVNLLFALARSGTPNIRYIVAYRPFDVASTHGGEEHHLARINRELTRYELCENIEVPPLTDEEVRSLCGTIAGHSDDEIVQKVKKFSGGNPLLALGWMEGGKVAASVEAIVVERIRRLDTDLRSLLMLAAAEGETFTSHVIRQLSTYQPMAIASMLRRAEAEHGLIRALGKMPVYSTETPAYVFSNQAIHRALEAMLGTEERELAHGTIADILTDERSSLGMSDSEWMAVSVRLAVHLELSDRQQESAAVYMEIAQRAWQLYAEHEALTAISNVYRLLGSVASAISADKEIRLNALDLESRIHQFAHRMSEVEHSTEMLRTFALECGSSKAAVNALVRRAQIANMNGNPEEVHTYAIQALDEATRIAYVDGMRGATSMLGMWHEANGRLDDAEACFRATFEYAVTEQSDKFKATSLVNIGRIFTHRSMYQEALECFNNAVEMLERERDWDGMARALSNVGICRVELGLFPEAAAAYERALELNERIGSRIGASSIRTNLGQLLLRQDKVEESLEQFEKSINLKRELADPYGLAIALYSKGLALSESGRFEESFEILEEAIQSAEESGEMLVIKEVNRITEIVRRASAGRKSEH